MSEHAETIIEPAASPTRRRRQRPTTGQLRRIGASVLAVVVLILSTIATFVYLPRYDQPGQPILENADFRDGFSGWQLAGLVTLDEVEMGLAMLQNLDPGKVAYLRRQIALPRERIGLALSADVAAHGVIGGAEPWQTARVYLVQQDPEGRYLWNQPHELANVVGSAPRQHFSAIFDIPGSTRAVLLGVELPYVTGRLEVANLRLDLLEERPLFRLAASLLVAGWTLVGGWVVLRLRGAIRSGTVRAWLFGTLAVLIIGIFMPAVLRQHLIDQLAVGFGFKLNDPDAIAHALIYALLALLVRIGRPRDPWWLHLSCWALAGAATEALQLLTADRSPETADWLMNALGAALGLAIAGLGLGVQRALKARPRKRGGLAREAGRGVKDGAA